MINTSQTAMTRQPQSSSGMLRAEHKAPTAAAVPHLRSGAAAARSNVECRAGTSITAPETMELGKSGLIVPTVGVGAWAWGDRSGYWGYGTQYGKEESRAAYKAIMSSGLSFIDTAEVYGFGKSEEFLGEFAREAGDNPLVATKFAPLPWRLNAEAVPIALKESLKRLQMNKVALYIQHWPGFLFNAFSNDAYIEGLISCKQQGLADAVGVSNFNAERVRSASKKMAAAGVALSSNQVQFSLLYREPERNGVMEACRENGVTPVAYSPLCQGLLTGKYKVGGERPFGPRAALFTDNRLREVQPLLSAMEAVAQARGKTMAQVAINWTMCKGALPIPGAKNERQLAEIAGSVGWRLSDAEVAELDAVSSRVPSSTGAPFEKW